jgi:glyoxylase-like metal-dependent hydrolase (beta-lactamase superfamily II)
VVIYLQDAKEDILIIKTLAVGPIMANCFVLGCEKSKEATVIDPGDETDRILMSLAESSLTLKFILNTHGHFDHVGGNKKLKESTGADILIHPLDVPMLEHLPGAASAWGLKVDESPPPDKTVDDGDVITFGEIELTVIHTPGHSPGGISFHSNGYVFVGDTLFAGSIGRTDFPGGDFQTLKDSIQKKLFRLDDDVRVFTGHGPETTIGNEKRYNPFVGMAS